MTLSTKPYKGARDFFPEDKRVLNQIVKNWKRVARRYGYEEVDAPIIEPLELFAAKSGDELVQEQSYSFTDRGGREVMLRPEITPSVSRMIAARRQELALPVRWFSIPWCWRYERPQKGRGREFYQLNLDLFGVEGIEAEIEMLQLINGIMKGFDARPDMYEIRLNDRRFMNYLLKDWLGLDEVETVTIARLIDRMHKIPGPEFIGLIEASIAPSLRDAGVAQKLLDVLNAQSIEALPKELTENPAFSGLKDALSACAKLGINNVRFDITLMRGLDYYTGLVFEVFDTEPENNRAMFGGGRYDGLVGLFGVEPIPTVGFAISDVVLLEFLKTHGLMPDTRTETEVWLIPLSDKLDEIRRIAGELRGMGVNVAVDLSKRKTDKQIKSALKNGVPYALFVGEKELESGQFTLKDLSKSEESTKSLERLVTIIKDRRTNKPIEDEDLLNV